MAGFQTDDYSSVSMTYEPESFTTYTASDLSAALEGTVASKFRGNLTNDLLANVTTVLGTLTSLFSTLSPMDATTDEATADVEVKSQDVEPLVHAEYPYYVLGFTAASAFIIAILGSFGNLLTIIALPMCKKLRTTATAFIVNLAVVELLFCLLILPMAGAQYLYLQQYDDALLTDRDCAFFTPVKYALTQVELQTILAIALTRALAVSVPRLYTSINRPIVMGCYIAGIWIYSFALKIPAIAGILGKYIFNTYTMECDMTSDNAMARLIYILVEAVIPVLLIFLMYVFVFVMVVRRAFIRQRKFSKNFPPPPQLAQVKLSSARVARATTRGKSKVAPPTTSTGSTSSTSASQRKGSNSSFKSLKKMVSDSNLRSRFTHQSSTVSQRLTTNRRDMRVARTIFIIFLLLLVCSVPVMTIHAVDRKAEDPVRFLLLHILYWVQYCVNTAVYVLMNRQYRDAYVDCLARVFPNMKAHHGRRFFWEKASISSKPQPNYTSTRPANPADSSASETDPDPAGPQGNTTQARLTAIPEGHSSSAANDSVFSDIQKKTQDDPPEEHRDAEISEGVSESEGSDSDDEQQALMDKEHWVSKNGSTGGNLPDDESKV
ncbi:G-protein coupled receptor moody-like isoform X2 [Homarus americanus]|uniref:G-protein coupled receptor moody-like isoform X2 n=1 Tax=Homarus americanus TaxID=6706 RepID=UPI001C4590D7|nr:G-protein coupled receptor moody-like isoform X2 [Homarus americanus]